jgi:hypothetical protein
MDEERRIRFLVAPALFVASLLIGALSDPTAAARLWEILRAPDWSKSLVELVAGGGVVVFAGGYVFGTITVFFLRLMFWFRSLFWSRHWGRCPWGRFHEVVLSDDSFQQVWERLGAPGKKPDRSKELSAGEVSKELCAGAAFDFDVLRKDHEGVHRWLFRRWNGFNIAAHSITALTLSFPAGGFIGIPLSLTWGLTVGIFEVFLWFVMLWAWNDTMDMLEFMASLEAKEPWPQPIPAGERAKVSK